MKNDSEILFSSGSLYDGLDRDHDLVRHKVAEIPLDQFDATTDDGLVTEILAQLLAEPLVLVEEQHFKQSFSDNGNQLSVEIPFTGEPALWRMKPHYAHSFKVHGIVDDVRSLLIMNFINEKKTGQEWCQRELQRKLEIIRSYLSSQADMLADHKVKLPAFAHQVVERRRTEYK